MCYVKTCLVDYIEATERSLMDSHPFQLFPPSQPHLQVFLPFCSWEWGNSDECFEIVWNAAEGRQGKVWVPSPHTWGSFCGLSISVWYRIYPDDWLLNYLPFYILISHIGDMRFCVTNYIGHVFSWLCCAWNEVCEKPHWRSNWRNDTVGPVSSADIRVIHINFGVNL